MVDRASSLPAGDTASAGGVSTSTQQQAPSAAATRGQCLSAVITALGSAGPRAAEQTALLLSCVCGRLDAAGAERSLPLLHLLAGLLSSTAAGLAAGPGPGGAPAIGQHGAASALADAVTQSGVLLELLQDLYARSAWQLPAAEMLAKLKGAGVFRTPTALASLTAGSGQDPCTCCCAAAAASKQPPTTCTPAAFGLGASHNLGGEDPDAAHVLQRPSALPPFLRSPAPSEPGTPPRRPGVPRLSLPLAGGAATPATASRRSMLQGEPRRCGVHEGKSARLRAHRA